MKIKVDSKFKDVLRNVATINDDVALTFTPKGMNCVVRDRAGTLISTIHLKKEAFEGYKVKEDLTIFIDLENMNSVLKAFSGSINLDIDENKVTISDDRYKFVVGLLNPFDIPKVPQDNLKFTADIELENSYCDNFKNDLNALEKIDNKVEMMIKDRDFSLHSIGIIGKADIDVKVKPLLENMKKATAIYPIDKLKMLYKLGGFKRIKFGKNMPMKIIADDRLVKVESLIAPIIDSGGEDEND